MKIFTLSTKFLLIASLSFTILTSCEKSEQQVKFRVNQFKQTAVALGPIMTLSIQQGEQIGSNNWTPLYDQIVGFSYEPGYIYEILVTETKIQNPPANGSSKGYILKQILSKTKVSTSERFSLNLKLDDTVFVTSNINNGYNILEQVDIDCANLCTEFDAAIHSNKKNVKGKFLLNENGSIKLVELSFD